MTRGFSTCLCLLVCVSAYGAFATVNAQSGYGSASAAADQSKTVWDGVYSAGQAEKGLVTYARACTSCHKDDLRADGKAEYSLAGPAFLARWKGRPLSDLYWKVAREQHRVTITMMRPREINETLSYILKVNGMPAGPAALSENFPDLEAILITEAPAKASR